MVLTALDYEQIALAEPERRWELHHGQLREKPPMSYGHNDVKDELAFMLRLQLDPANYRVRVDSGRVRRTEDTYYIPDIIVIPAALTAAFRQDPRRFEVYDLPVALVVEVWSPSTGDYDIDSKLPEYRARGDLEIWRIHPFERTLTTWRRQPDGSYDETLYTGGTVTPVALPGVKIDLDRLFAFIAAS